MVSARKLVQVLLDAKDLYPSHRKEFIRLAPWKVTEAECASKYNTRYRSLAAQQQPHGRLHHEHVYERGKMADDLIADPDRLHKILDNAVACTVTEEEHRQLTTLSSLKPHLQGWDRYRHAGLTVIDMATGDRILP